MQSKGNFESNRGTWKVRKLRDDSEPRRRKRDKRARRERREFKRSLAESEA